MSAKPERLASDGQTAVPANKLRPPQSRNSPHHPLPKPDRGNHPLHPIIPFIRLKSVAPTRALPHRSNEEECASQLYRRPVRGCPDPRRLVGGFGPVRFTSSGKASRLPGLEVVHLLTAFAPQKPYPRTNAPSPPRSLQHRHRHRLPPQPSTPAAGRGCARRPRLRPRPRSAATGRAKAHDWPSNHAGHPADTFSLSSVIEDTSSHCVPMQPMVENEER